MQTRALDLQHGLTILVRPLQNGDVDTVVAVSGLDQLTGVRDGNPFSTTGRVTFVIAKRGTDWQIVQFHRSPVPN